MMKSLMQAFKISYSLKNTYRVNSIIYSIRQLPLIKKILPVSLYGIRGFKIFANVLSVLWEISSAFLGKFLYILLMVTAVSGLSALVGVTEENIAFENGYDLSFLERAEPLCVVSQSYAAQYGLNSGDTLSMPFYVTRYNDDGFSLRYEHLGMQGVKIIGVYADSASGSAVPCSMIVSVPWLQTVVKENNLRFYYSSFRCALRDPMKLNDFKDAMRGAGFAKPDPNALDERHGDTLVVDDQLFIETAEKLEQNLKVLRWFLAPFFALVIVLVTLVTFLLLRSTRRDMAISLSLGRPKILSGCACFFGTLIANVCGCAVAVPILLCTAGLALGQILTICGLYLASSCVGVLLALILLLRFDALELLTKID